MAQRPPDPDGVRRTGEARDRQTARPDAAARGSGNLRNGSTTSDPLYVHITGAERDYYDGFRSPGAAQRPGSDPGQVSGAGFEALLSQQSAIAEEAKRAASDMKLAADAARQFGVAQTANLAAQARAQREERSRIDEVLARIEQTFQQVAQNAQGGRQRPGTAPPREQRPAGPSDPIGGQQRPDDAQDLTDLNGGQGPLGPMHGPARPPNHPRNRPGGPAPDRELGPVHGPDPAPEAPPESRYDLHLGRGRQTAHRVSRGQVQRRMRSSVGRAMHENWGLGHSQSPTIHPVLDEQGNTTHYNRHHPDGTVEQIETSDPALPGMLRGRAVQGAVSDVAGTLGAEGVGAAARVGIDAIPYVGEVAMAAQVASGVADFVAEQRKSNAQYQSIYGGTNIEGMGQRIQAYGYGLGQTFSGGRTQGDASQMFQGVSQLGFSGEERSNMLDMDQALYKKIGISTSQSLQAITIAAQHSNSSLAGVAQALTSVTSSARATGQSADTLRQQFLNVFQTTSAAGLGPNAATAAAAYTNADVGANRSLGGVNYSGAMSDTYTRMAAAANNMTPGALQSSDAFKGTSLRNQFTDQGVARAGQNLASPEVVNAYNKAVAAKGGASKVAASQGAQLDVASQVLAAGFDSTMYQQQVLAQTGVDIGTDPLANAQYYVDHQSGNTYTGQQKKIDDTHKDKTLTDNDKASFWSGDTSTDEHNVPIPMIMRGNVSKFVAQNYGLNLFSGGVRAKNADLDSYDAWQQTSNQSNPVMESLINQYGHDSSTGVKIQTKDGDKVVPMSEAIKYAPDQLAKGTASLVGGSNDGQSVQTALGFSDSTYKGPDTTGQAGPADGVSTDQWKKDNPTDQSTAQAANGSTNVQITMSDDLKRWFGTNVNGTPTNPSTEAGAAAAVPPAQTTPGGGN